MKFYLLLFLLSLSTLTKAQFAAPIKIGDPAAAQLIRTGQMAGDSLPDIIVMQNAWPDDYIVMYENEGDFSFKDSVVFSPMPVRGIILAMEPADLNNDGLTDVVVAYTDVYVSKNRVLGWIENVGRHQNKFHVIRDSVRTVDQLKVGDFNNDGLMDVLSLEDVTVKIYYNDSAQSFKQERLILAATEYYALEPMDLNGDEWLDVVAASQGFQTVTSAEDTAYWIGPKQGGGLPFGVWSGDSDGDGDQDVLVWSHAYDLQHYRNDNGVLHLRQTIDPLDNIKSLELIDVDRDGDLDIVTTRGQTGQLLWLENRDSLYSDTAQFIATFSGQLMYQIHADDLNADGLEDLICANLDLHVIPANKLSTGSRGPHLSYALFPNPARNHINLYDPNEAFESYTLYDALGKRLEHNPLLDAHIDLQGLPAGTYTLVLMDDKGNRLAVERLSVVNE